MKKFLIVLVFIIIMPVLAFARPSGFGIGVVYQCELEWHEDFAFYGNILGLSLKMPGSHMHMGIYFRSSENALNFSITGDRLIASNYFGSSNTLGYFIGIGAYFGFGHYKHFPEGESSYNTAALNVGARVPFGMSLFPVPFLELFGAITPRLGLDILLGGGGDTLQYPVGGVGFDFGLRLWL